MSDEINKLFEELNKTQNLAKFICDYKDELIDSTVGKYLTALLEKKDLKVSDVAAKSRLGNYTYRIFKDERAASREALISIAIGMNLAIWQTQQLLQIARHADLDPRFVRDTVFVFALSNGYSVDKTNDLLYELGEKMLGVEK